jgi:SAM-dependent methyltransferase
VWQSGNAPSPYDRLVAGSPTPQPPDRLAERVGGPAESYRYVARFHRERILSLLPADWTWDGKRVLDFGCGPGRTLSEFSEEAERAAFVGCDIHPESIEWARRNLPTLTFVHNQEQPPVKLPSESFDLVYGVSVFTHLTEHWSGWLAEVHRLLRPGGLGIFSFLGQALWRPFGAGASVEWVEDETGMLVTAPGRSWDDGGPNVFHSEWWLREHWGRGFEIVELRARDCWHGVEGHGWILLRRRSGEITATELERIDPAEPREARALARNLRLLIGEAQAESAHALQLARDAICLRDQLDAVYACHSWRLTAPLRALAQHVRRPSGQERGIGESPIPRIVLVRPGRHRGRRPAG